MSVDISAVICTHNRARYLREAIQSLAVQSLAKTQYEILIVDNASTDNTQQVVHEFSGMQNLKFIYEPVIGLSHARNTGWRNAAGTYVAYLDDDARAHPVWLEKIIEVFETVSPKPGCVGGKIEPIWEAPKPRWLDDRALGQLSILDWGDKAEIIRGEKWLAGANVAYPRILLEEIGGFNIKLGRIGSKLLSMEENMARIEIEKKGYRCLYHPEIRVAHHILPERLTQTWFMKRAYWSGVGSALIQINQKPPTIAKRLNKAMTTLLRIALSPMEMLSLLIPTDDPDRFFTKCSVRARIGNAMTLLGIAK